MELHNIVRSVQIQTGYSSNDNEFVSSANDLTAPTPSVVKILDILDREHNKMLSSYHWAFARKITTLDTLDDHFIQIPLLITPGSEHSPIENYAGPFASVSEFEGSPAWPLRLSSNTTQSVSYVLGLSRPDAWSTAHTLPFALGQTQQTRIGGVSYSVNPLTLDATQLPFAATYIAIIGRDEDSSAEPVGFFADAFRSSTTFALLPDDLLSIIAVEPNQPFQIVGNRLLLRAQGLTRLEYTARIAADAIPDTTGALYLEALIARSAASAIPILSRGASPAIALEMADNAWKMAVNRNAQTRSSDYTRNSPFRQSRYSYGVRGYYQ